MKKYMILITCSLFSMFMFAQTYLYDYTAIHCTTQENEELFSKSVSSNNNYNSAHGWEMPTSGRIRALSFFINIIYDLTPAADPKSNPNTAWTPASYDCINNPAYTPYYLLDVFDINVSAGHNYNGMVTRLYAESSFNNLIILSDFVVVNIKQSQIQTSGVNHSFSGTALLDAVITYINNNGGLITIYGNNEITEYDVFGNTVYGQEKKMNPDGKIDLGNFFIRNSTKSHGSVPRGSGNANTTKPSTSVKLKIGNQFYSFNNTTYQCEGSGNFAQYKKSIITHEIAHLFLGSNEMHTSNREGHEGCTFLGFQGGHGLFGGGLLSCNAYERWRLGWKNEITANNTNSDITTQFPNEQTFILRDFVTYGDAIRIKLPFKDNITSLNQYIWLENHQVDTNNKIDGYVFNNVSECRKVNQAGIYAYYQIGKDVLEGNIYSNVYPYNESDNLKMISAEGNYNVSYLNNEEDCIGGVDLYLRSYSNQTENIDKLIEELEKTEHADRLAALGLTSVFDELVAAQQAFKSIYLEQSEPMPHFVFLHRQAVFANGCKIRSATTCNLYMP